MATEAGIPDVILDTKGQAEDVSLTTGQFEKTVNEDISVELKKCESQTSEYSETNKVVSENKQVLDSTKVEIIKNVVGKNFGNLEDGSFLTAPSAPIVCKEEASKPEHCLVDEPNSSEREISKKAKHLQEGQEFEVSQEAARDGELVEEKNQEPDFDERNHNTGTSLHAVEVGETEFEFEREEIMEDKIILDHNVSVILHQQDSVNEESTEKETKDSEKDEREKMEESQPELFNKDVPSILEATSDHNNEVSVHTTDLTLSRDDQSDKKTNLRDEKLDYNIKIETTPLKEEYAEEREFKGVEEEDKCIDLVTEKRGSEVTCSSEDIGNEDEKDRIMCDSTGDASISTTGLSQESQSNKAGDPVKDKLEKILVADEVGERDAEITEEKHKEVSGTPCQETNQDDNETSKLEKDENPIENELQDKSISVTLFDTKEEDISSRELSDAEILKEYSEIRSDYIAKESKIEVTEPTGVVEETVPVSSTQQDLDSSSRKQEDIHEQGEKLDITEAAEEEAQRTEGSNLVATDDFNSTVECVQEKITELDSRNQGAEAEEAQEAEVSGSVLAKDTSTVKLIQAEELTESDSTRDEEHIDDSLLQQNEPEEKKLQTDLNVISEINHAGFGGDSATIASVIKDGETENIEEIFENKEKGEEPDPTCETEIMQNPLSIHSDNKIQSTVAEFLINEADNSHVPCLLVEQAEVQEKVDKADQESHEEDYKTNETSKTDEKPYGDESVYQGSEKDNLQHTTSERTVQTKIELEISESTEKLEEDCGLHSKGSLETEAAREDISGEVKKETEFVDVDTQELTTKSHETEEGSMLDDIKVDDTVREMTDNPSDQMEIHEDEALTSRGDDESQKLESKGHIVDDVKFSIPETIQGETSKRNQDTVKDAEKLNEEEYNAEIKKEGHTAAFSPENVQETLKGYENEAEMSKREVVEEGERIGAGESIPCETRKDIEIFVDASSVKEEGKDLDPIEALIKENKVEGTFSTNVLNDNDSDEVKESERPLELASKSENDHQQAVQKDEPEEKFECLLQVTPNEIGTEPSSEHARNITCVEIFEELETTGASDSIPCKTNEDPEKFVVASSVKQEDQHEVDKELDPVHTLEEETKHDDSLSTKSMEENEDRSSDVASKCDTDQQHALKEEEPMKKLAELLLARLEETEKEPASEDGEKFVVALSMKQEDQHEVVKELDPTEILKDETKVDDTLSTTTVEENEDNKIITTDKSTNIASKDDKDQQHALQKDEPREKLAELLFAMPKEIETGSASEDAKKFVVAKSLKQEDQHEVDTEIDSLDTLKEETKVDESLSTKAVEEDEDSKIMTVDRSTSITSKGETSQQYAQQKGEQREKPEDLLLAAPKEIETELASEDPEKFDVASLVKQEDQREVDKKLNPAEALKEETKVDESLSINAGEEDKDNKIIDRSTDIASKSDTDQQHALQRDEPMKKLAELLLARLEETEMPTSEDAEKFVVALSMKQKDHHEIDKELDPMNSMKEETKVDDTLITKDLEEEETHKFITIERSTDIASKGETDQHPLQFDKRREKLEDLLLVRPEESKTESVTEAATNDTYMEREGIIDSHEENSKTETEGEKAKKTDNANDTEEKVLETTSASQETIEHALRELDGDEDLYSKITETETAKDTKEMQVITGVETAPPSIEIKEQNFDKQSIAKQTSLSLQEEMVEKSSKESEKELAILELQEQNKVTTLVEEIKPETIECSVKPNEDFDTTETLEEETRIEETSLNEAAREPDDKKEVLSHDITLEEKSLATSVDVEVQSDSPLSEILSEEKHDNEEDKIYNGVPKEEGLENIETGVIFDNANSVTCLEVEAIQNLEETSKTELKEEEVKNLDSTIVSKKEIVEELETARASESVPCETKEDVEEFVGASLVNVEDEKANNKELDLTESLKDENKVDDTSSTKVVEVEVENNVTTTERGMRVVSSSEEDKEALQKDEAVEKLDNLLHVTHEESETQPASEDVTSASCTEVEGLIENLKETSKAEDGVKGFVNASLVNIEDHKAIDKDLNPVDALKGENKVDDTSSTEVVEVKVENNVTSTERGIEVALTSEEDKEAAQKDEAGEKLDNLLHVTHEEGETQPAKEDITSVTCTEVEGVIEDLKETSKTEIMEEKETMDNAIDTEVLETPSRGPKTNEKALREPDNVEDLYPNFIDTKTTKESKETQVTTEVETAPPSIERNEQILYDQRTTELSSSSLLEEKEMLEESSKNIDKGEDMCLALKEQNEVKDLVEDVKAKILEDSATPTEEKVAGENSQETKPVVHGFDSISIEILNDKTSLREVKPDNEDKEVINHDNVIEEERLENNVDVKSQAVSISPEILHEEAKPDIEKHVIGYNDVPEEENNIETNVQSDSVSFGTVSGETSLKEGLDDEEEAKSYYIAHSTTTASEETSLQEVRLDNSEQVKGCEAAPDENNQPNNVDPNVQDDSISNKIMIVEASMNEGEPNMEEVKSFDIAPEDNGLITIVTSGVQSISDIESEDSCLKEVTQEQEGHVNGSSVALQEKILPRNVNLGVQDDFVSTKIVNERTSLKEDEVNMEEDVKSFNIAPEEKSPVIVDTSEVQYVSVSAEIESEDPYLKESTQEHEEQVKGSTAILEENSPPINVYLCVQEDSISNKIGSQETSLKEDEPNMEEDVKSFDIASEEKCLVTDVASEVQTFFVSTDTESSGSFLKETIQEKEEQLNDSNNALEENSPATNVDLDVQDDFVATKIVKEGTSLKEDKPIMEKDVKDFDISPEEKCLVTTLTSEVHSVLVSAEIESEDSHLKKAIQEHGDQVNCTNAALEENSPPGNGVEPNKEEHGITLEEKSLASNIDIEVQSDSPSPEILNEEKKLKELDNKEEDRTYNDVPTEKGLDNIEIGVISDIANSVACLEVEVVQNLEETSKAEKKKEETKNLNSTTDPEKNEIAEELKTARASESVPCNIKEDVEGFVGASLVNIEDQKAIDKKLDPVDALKEENKVDDNCSTNLVEVEVENNVTAMERDMKVALTSEEDKEAAQKDEAGEKLDNLLHVMHEESETQPANEDVTSVACTEVEGVIEDLKETSNLENREDIEVQSNVVSAGVESVVACSKEVKQDHEKHVKSSTIASEEKDLTESVDIDLQHDFVSTEIVNVETSVKEYELGDKELVKTTDIIPENEGSISNVDVDVVSGGNESGKNFFDENKARNEENIKTFGVNEGLGTEETRLKEVDQDDEVDQNDKGQVNNFDVAPEEKGVASNVGGDVQNKENSDLEDIKEKIPTITSECVQNIEKEVKEITPFEKLLDGLSKDNLQDSSTVLSKETEPMITEANETPEETTTDKTECEIAKLSITAPAREDGFLQKEVDRTLEPCDTEQEVANEDSQMQMDRELDITSEITSDKINTTSEDVVIAKREVIKDLESLQEKEQSVKIFNVKETGDSSESSLNTEGVHTLLDLEANNTKTDELPRNQNLEPGDLNEMLSYTSELVHKDQAEETLPLTKKSEVLGDNTEDTKEISRKLEPTSMVDDNVNETQSTEEIITTKVHEGVDKAIKTENTKEEIIDGKSNLEEFHPESNDDEKVFKNLEPGDLDEMLLYSSESVHKDQTEETLTLTKKTATLGEHSEHTKEISREVEPTLMVDNYVGETQSTDKIITTEVHEGVDKDIKSEKTKEQIIDGKSDQREFHLESNEDERVFKETCSDPIITEFLKATDSEKNTSSVDSYTEKNTTKKDETLVTNPPDEESINRQTCIALPEEKIEEEIKEEVGNGLDKSDTLTVKKPMEMTSMEEAQQVDGPANAFDNEPEERNLEFPKSECSIPDKVETMKLEERSYDLEFQHSKQKDMEIEDIVEENLNVNDVEEAKLYAAIGDVDTIKPILEGENLDTDKIREDEIKNGQSLEEGMPEEQLQAPCSTLLPEHQKHETEIETTIKTNEDVITESDMQSSDSIEEETPLTKGEHSVPEPHEVAEERLRTDESKEDIKAAPETLPEYNNQESTRAVEEDEVACQISTEQVEEVLSSALLTEEPEPKATEAVKKTEQDSTRELEILDNEVSELLAKDGGEETYLKKELEDFKVEEEIVETPSTMLTGDESITNRAISDVISNDQLQIPLSEEQENDTTTTFNDADEEDQKALNILDSEYIKDSRAPEIGEVTCLQEKPREIKIVDVMGSDETEDKNKGASQIVHETNLKSTEAEPEEKIIKCSEEIAEVELVQEENTTVVEVITKEDEEKCSQKETRELLVSVSTVEEITESTERKSKEDSPNREVINREISNNQPLPVDKDELITDQAAPGGISTEQLQKSSSSTLIANEHKHEAMAIVTNIEDDEEVLEDYGVEKTVEEICFDKEQPKKIQVSESESWIHAGDDIQGSSNEKTKKESETHKEVPKTEPRETEEEKGNAEPIRAAMEAPTLDIGEREIASDFISEGTQSHESLTTIENVEIFENHLKLATTDLTNEEYQRETISKVILDKEALTSIELSHKKESLIVEEAQSTHETCKDQTPKEADNAEIKAAKITTSNKDSPPTLPELVEETSQRAESKDIKTRNETWAGDREIKDEQCGKEKEAVVSLSELIQSSTEENTQVVEHLSKEKELKSSKEVEHSQIHEEDDEEEEEEHEDEDHPDAPILVQASKDIDAKAARKKSQGIFSGVGSKVKHSISKVKKVITGKSSHSTTTTTKTQPSSS
ncbi:hypothetical protein CsatB_020365 [Cannabis sativa]